jgi:amino acid transporter
MFTGSFMGLAYLVTSDDALKIFSYFVNSVTIFGSLIWVSQSHISGPSAHDQICILSSHIGFMRGMKAQGIPRSSLPFVAVGPVTHSHVCVWLTYQPFQPYLTYASLALVVLLSIFKGFDAFMPFDVKSFITSYIGIPVFVFGYLGFKRESNRSTIFISD